LSLSHGGLLLCLDRLSTSRYAGTPWLVHSSPSPFLHKFTNTIIGWSWAQVRTYFQSLAADSSKDASLVTMCKSNAAWCLAEMDQWENARAELDSLLNHSSKDYDRLALSLKMLMTELQQDDAFFQTSMANSGNYARGVTNGHVDAAPATEFVDRLIQVDNRVDSVMALYGHGGGKIRSGHANLLPTKYTLYQNYPNPFNPTTEIRFDVPEAARVELRVFNTLGQLVTTLVDETRPAGAYRVAWDGKDVSAGMYIYQLKAGNFTDAKKMVLIK
jgi:hypothetical protein